MESSNSNLPREKSGVGTLVASILIIAVVVVGLIYFWKNRGTNEVLDVNSVGSSSDEVQSIEADLNATDIDSVDVIFDAEASAS